MAIITIARELAALEDETVKELVKRTGYKLIDRKTIENKMKEAGLSESHLQKYDEKSPAFIDSISAERDDYLRYLKLVMTGEALNGDCIFVGRGASAIFSGVLGVLSVFLCSSLNVRIARVKSYFGCDEKRARLIIEQSDLSRMGFNKYFFETNWNDPGNYHVTFNTSKAPPALCADMIVSLEQSMFNAETYAKAKVVLQELFDACTIVNHALYTRKIIVHFLEAAVRNNEVVLYGVAQSANIAEAACSAALEVAPGKKINSKIQVVQDYPILPIA